MSNERIERIQVVCVALDDEKRRSRGGTEWFLFWRRERLGDRIAARCCRKGKRARIHKHKGEEEQKRSRPAASAAPRKRKSAAASGARARSGSNKNRYTKGHGWQVEKKRQGDEKARVHMLYTRGQRVKRKKPGKQQKQAALWHPALLVASSLHPFPFARCWLRVFLTCVPSSSPPPHPPLQWNCSASVEPASAVVEQPSSVTCVVV